jgi:hypothetical protein
MGPPSPQPARRVLSNQERSAILDQKLVAMASQGGRIETRTDNQAVVVSGKPVNHILHLLISVLLCGLRLPVWVLVAVTGGERRVTITVDKNGQVIRPQRKYDQRALILGVATIIGLVLFFIAAHSCGNHYSDHQSDRPPVTYSVQGCPSPS